MKLWTINRFLRPFGFVLSVDIPEGNGWIRLSFRKASRFPLVEIPVHCDVAEPLWPRVVCADCKGQGNFGHDSAGCPCDPPPKCVALGTIYGDRIYALVEPSRTDKT